MSARAISGRRLLAGFLAGASGLVAVLLFVAFLLVIGAFWPLFSDIVSGLRGQLPFWPTIGKALVDSFGNLPAFLWSARWGVVGLGLLGLVLAAVDALGMRIERPWRHLVSLVALLGLTGTIVFALQYANRESVLAWLAEHPDLINLQESALLSDLGSLAIGALITLPSAYLIWALWQWWDVRWGRWLSPKHRAVATHKEPAAEAENWNAYQTRLHRLKRHMPEANAGVEAAPAARPAPDSQRLLRLLLALLGVATLVLVASLWAYNRSGSQIFSGDLFVSAQSPSETVGLQFQRHPQRVVVAVLSGEGLVDIAFGDIRDLASPQQTAQIKLTNAQADSPSAVFDLRESKPGRYWLRVNLQAGDSGHMRYTTLQGGEIGARIGAWAIGLASGVWLVLGALVVLELVTERGWMHIEGA